ncbi:MAG TPA: chloride channel protein, partial [Gemmatimonadales bacterium]|nr:chloride channel protein [Gemmatimonadales bacterium]
MTADRPTAVPEIPQPASAFDRRLFLVAALAVLVAASAGVMAEVLQALISFFTNLSFYGTLSFAPQGPAGNRLGVWVVLVPVLGGLIVGVMARWGSPAIRGHGIPEVMERVLVGESRIAPRVTVLKPLATAIAIGTGGPFGAEGPIIATGGALG